MNVITNIDSRKFQLNGTRYVKNFLSKPIGNKLIIFNCYDNKEVLVEPVLYTEFSVNGVVYPNVNALQEALLVVLYNRTGLSDGTFPDATVQTKGKLRFQGDFDLTSTADTPRIRQGTSATAGKVKLYTSLGSNEDGALTQKLASEHFSIKIMSDGAGTDYVSSSTGTVLFKTYTIPANIMTEGVYKLYFSFPKSIGTNHTCNYNIYISENPITYSQGLGIVTGLASAGAQPLDRGFFIYTKNGVTKLLVPSQQASSSADVASAYPVVEYDFNKNVQHYIHVVATAPTGQGSINPALVHRLAGGYVIKM